MPELPTQAVHSPVTEDRPTPPHYRVAARLQVQAAFQAPAEPRAAVAQAAAVFNTLT